MIENLSVLSESDCISIQEALAPKTAVSHHPSLEQAKTIAGVDLAYWKQEREYAVCCIVTLDMESLAVVERVHAYGAAAFPYIPGCLAFRELPLVLEAAKKMAAPADVYLFDGNGILHPRRMGLATHASFYLNRPTLGVAKSYYKVDGIPYEMPDDRKGAFTDIKRGEEVLGRAVRTQQGVRPVFVSVGNGMDLEQATALALKTTDGESHIPLPTRLADLDTHKWRSRYQTAAGG